MKTKEYKRILVLLVVMIILLTNGLLNINGASAKEFKETEEIKMTEETTNYKEANELTRSRRLKSEKVKIVSDKDQLLEALKYNNINHILIDNDVEFDKDFISGDSRIINRQLTIEVIGDKKPIISVKDGKRHFYIETDEEVVLKNLIFKGIKNQDEDLEESGGIY